MGFLMVGHTHEDIDQVFSSVATHLRRVDCVTLPDLQKGLQESSSTQTAVYHLTGLNDYKAALEDCRGILTGISGPHQFVISLVANKVMLRTKNWPREDQVESELDLTDVIPEIPSEFNSVRPNPKIASEIMAMIKDMDKWQVSGRLSNAQMVWWTRYLERSPVPFVNVPSILSLPAYTEPFTICEDVSHLRTAIEKTAEREDAVTRVSLKRKRINRT
ncbi:hypothetical protein DPMN_147469 [Dreissena polymorpha]|uniref:DUF7869 domain-containing protein n=1 Tax=Dreissena polymorpha TaxID=45954 RepID=A0A9D4IZC6_DREPO|nr:hypothetical protein DPMN_147469 [Dreissena polymorpha]